MTRKESAVNGSDETMNIVEEVIMMMIEKVIHHSAN
jgi:hypothetical protein